MMYKKMRSRRKVCFFKKNHIKYVDYKDFELLSRFINPDGKISPRSATGTSAKYQRELARAVKNARYMGMLPYPGQR
ncbi:MAG: 30S ribosomal protein S18 [Bacilli bacterium]|nr:30S ribosomal protein S18 [Bacilli bacterium]